MRTALCPATLVAVVLTSAVAVAGQAVTNYDEGVVDTVIDYGSGFVLYLRTRELDELGMERGLGITTRPFWVGQRVKWNGSKNVDDLLKKRVRVISEPGGDMGIAVSIWRLP